MLSAQDNQTMCRVGPDAPMGQALRRYWLPLMLTSELAEPGADQKPVELLGEQLVAYRDASGRVGVFAQACLHRGASMLLARAEGDGLRCIYHGWKFAVDGQVLATPNVADPKFKERIRGRVYPSREAGGLIWAYLGPADKLPPFPRWPWLDLPEANRLATLHIQECNFVQILEGLVDSSHLGVLHKDGMQRSTSTDLGFAQKISSMQFDLAPRLEAQDTDFGFHYVALRDVKSNTDAGPGLPTEVRTEARVAAFIAPCFVLNPNGDIATLIVPLGDHRTAFFAVFWDTDKRINEEPLKSTHLRFLGLDAESMAAYGLTRDTLGRHGAPSRENHFLQDRAAMRRGERWSGLQGIIEDDAAVSISSGPIRDRNQELLSAADAAVTRLYRVLLRCARQVQEGGDPVGLGGHVDSARIVGANGVVAPGSSWQSLVPDHVVIGANEFDRAPDSVAAA